MVNDRGSKKWTSLMLPEHIRELRRVFQEEEYEEKPILDKQAMIENDYKLKKALQNKLIIQIKYFANHDFHFIQGKINYIDDQNIKIEELKIPLDDVIEVNVD